MREKVPGIAIRTTVIVGFPNETEENFANYSILLKNLDLQD